VPQEFSCPIFVTLSNVVNNGLKERDNRVVSVMRPPVHSLRQSKWIDKQSIVGVQGDIDEIKLRLSPSDVKRG
jgi:hypothetical protein